MSGGAGLGRVLVGLAVLAVVALPLSWTVCGCASVRHAEAAAAAPVAAQRDPVATLRAVCNLAAGLLDVSADRIKRDYAADVSARDAACPAGAVGEVCRERGTREARAALEPRLAAHDRARAAQHACAAGSSAEAETVVRSVTEALAGVSQ